MPLAHTAHPTDGTDAVGWLLVALLVLVPSFAYLTAARARRGAGRTWPSWRAASFVIGLVLVAAVVSPALHTLGHHDPRGHMIQHLLLGMFAPLALVLAAPVTLLLGVLPVARRGTARTLLHSRVLRGVAHPVTAAVLDMGGLYLLYLTPLYTLTVANPLVHHLVSLHFLLAGYLFAWSIAGPDPAPCRPSIAIRAGMLIAAGAAHAYLAKLLYARAAEHLLESSHDLDGMQAAAQLMYYGGDLAELALATALFAMWYRTRQPAARNAHHVSTSKTSRSPRHAASTKRDRLSPCLVKTREKVGTRTPGEAVLGRVVGPLEAPEVLLLGRLDPDARMRMAGSTTRLPPAVQSEVEALLAPRRRKHLWPERTASVAARCGPAGCAGHLCAGAAGLPESARGAGPGRTREEGEELT